MLYGWSFYNAWAGPVLDAVSDWRSGYHYTEPGWLLLTYLIVTQLPALALAGTIAILRLRRR